MDNNETNNKNKDRDKDKDNDKEQEKTTNDIHNNDGILILSWFVHQK